MVDLLSTLVANMRHRDCTIHLSPIQSSVDATDCRANIEMLLTGDRHRNKIGHGLDVRRQLSGVLSNRNQRVISSIRGNRLASIEIESSVPRNVGRQDTQASASRSPKPGSSSAASPSPPAPSVPTPPPDGHQLRLASQITTGACQITTVASSPPNHRPH